MMARANSSPLRSEGLACAQRSGLQIVAVRSALADPADASADGQTARRARELSPLRVAQMTFVDTSTWTRRGVATASTASRATHRRGLGRSTRSCSSSISHGVAGYAAATANCRSTFPTTTNSRSGCAAKRGATTSSSSSSMRPGDNVWWFRRANFKFSGDWQQMRIKQAADRLRVGTDQRSDAAPLRVDRVRAERRRRGRQRHSVVRSRCA